MSSAASPPLAPFGTILDALPDAVIVFAADGAIVYANRRALDLFGYSAEEMARCTTERLIPQRFRDGQGIGSRLFMIGQGSTGTPTSRQDIFVLLRDGRELAVEATVAVTAHEDRPVAVVTLRPAVERDRAAAAERVAAVVASSSDAILTKDLAGTITSWNAGAQRIYGYTPEEVIGRPVTILMDAERAHEMNDILDQIKLGEDVEPFETVRIRKDGRRLDVSVSVSPLRDASGEIIGASTVARDITERKRADETVRALLESAPDAVVVVDERGCMVLVNRQTEALFGYHREALLGEQVELLIPERLRDADTYDVSSFTSPSGHAGALELIGRQADGREFPIEITFNPLHTRDGMLVYTAIRDITERKLMDEELRRSNYDLEQFAYVASHDLSEPLRVIAGFVDLLARRYRGQLDEEADRFIDFTVSGVERLQTLIDDLLAYSRAGRVQIDAREVDTEAVVRDVLWALEPQLTAKHVAVDVDKLPVVRAEQTLLRQIFQNLLVNAVKFSDAEQPRVRVSAQRAGEAWRFDVADNGPGVDRRHAERIFDMFQRLHGREVAGSGMGLAIVKRLTERHGGRVWVSAAEPRGSVFSFTIPDRPRA